MLFVCIYCPNTRLSHKVILLSMSSKQFLECISILLVEASVNDRVTAAVESRQYDHDRITYIIIFATVQTAERPNDEIRTQEDEKSENKYSQGNDIPQIFTKPGFFTRMPVDFRRTSAPVSFKKNQKVGDS